MTAREGRWVGAWLALAAASFVSLPWYFQADKSLVQALVDVWGGADSASGIVEAVRHGRAWLAVCSTPLAASPEVQAEVSERSWPDSVTKYQGSSP